MGQIFVDERVVPVTFVKAGPCIVTQIKSREKDGYDAVQLGFGYKKNIKKAQKVRFGKLSKLAKDLKSDELNFRFLKEFRINPSEKKNYKLGDRIDVSVFRAGDKILVAGVSKGKGFQGVVKRHGFSGGPKTHGHRHVLRTLGSIGSSFPQKVFKGKKMPGRTGGQRVTVKGLEIIDVDKERNLIAVKGALPGPKKSLLEIQTIDA